ncbi:MAG: DUF4832 domain-containing protein, partial [Actinomycetota bacterium]|nr:DUF4832 domain-containing protein [Actinomycetota bacterium]
MSGGRAIPGAGAVVALATGVLCGCGGGERQAGRAPAGTYRIEVTRVAFPARQHLGEQATLTVTVRNAGRRTVRR